MTLVGSQPVTLYQTGDLVEGVSNKVRSFYYFKLNDFQASFNNLLDALDGSYCTFEGGDDPTEDGWIFSYHITYPRH